MANIIGGCPIKIFHNGLLYIPKGYWSYYGINSERDKIIREDREKTIVFSHFEQRELKDNESIKKIYMGRAHIHPMWMKLNKVKAGEILWLIGTDEGLVLSVHSHGIIIQN